LVGAVARKAIVLERQFSNEVFLDLGLDFGVSPIMDPPVNEFADQPRMLTLKHRIKRAAAAGREAISAI
jgi:hypothetical protein